MSHVTQDKWIKLRKQYPITENKVYLKNASISGMHSKVIKRSHEWNHSIACEGAVNEQRFGDLVFAARDTVAHYLNIPNVESVTLTVDDKNIEMGSVDTPTDTTADGGGITLKGTTDKTILYEKDTKSWDFNQKIITKSGEALRKSLHRSWVMGG